MDEWSGSLRSRPRESVFLLSPEWTPRCWQAIKLHSQHRPVPPEAEAPSMNHCPRARTYSGRTQGSIGLGEQQQYEESQMAVPLGKLGKVHG